MGGSSGFGRSGVARMGMLVLALALQQGFGCASDATGGTQMRQASGDDGSMGSTPPADGAPGSDAAAADATDDFSNPDGPAPEVMAPSGAAGDGGEQAEPQIEVCVQDSAEATLELRPIDVVFVIDTSPSMVQEIAGVQQNINDNFATIIGASGIDYRVVLISDDGVCIQGTLNPGGCGTSNPPTFQWIDADVGSHDAWCVLLETYPQWSGMLRPEAFKVLVTVTDDSPSCSAAGARFGPDQAGADAFDAALLALDSAQFGTAAERNYTFHSLVALAENTPATAAYAPADPVVTAECATAADTGEGYQHLSKDTAGLRFPVCEGNNFDAVFRTIAEGIVEGAAVACEFEIPAQGEGGQEIDRSTVEVAYVPGDRSATRKFDAVDDVAACADQAFFIEGDTVQLCPSACEAVKSDHEAEVQVLFGCDICAGLDADCGVSPPPTLPPVE